ncbi:MAG: LysR family transcriptional regulator [Rubrivivax sp.]|nr:LysR family transcriptional regulator [Rubrivivax sp.]
MDLRQLRYFLAVADAGQLTAAAAVVGIQQPPLSQQISALERQLGLRLFDRHAKGVTLTEGGRLVAAEARRLLDDFEAMRSRVDAVARGQRGVLQVAFTSSAAAHAFTPQALRACRQRYPAIEWVVSESNAAEITEGVASGRLHCGFLRAPVAWPEGVLMRTLLREPMAAAIPLDHPLAGRRTVALADLHGQPLILVRRPGAPGLYANLLMRCRAAGAEPRVVAEVERMMTSLNLVAAGVGLTVVPASMKGAHEEALVYRDLARGVDLDAPLTLLYRADRHEGALASFVALVGELSAGMPGAQARARSARAVRAQRRTAARGRT